MEERTNLHLVPGTAIAPSTDNEEWIEEIDESALPPNQWQREVESLVQLEDEIWEERHQLLEESSPEGD